MSSEAAGSQGTRLYLAQRDVSGVFLTSSHIYTLQMPSEHAWHWHQHIRCWQHPGSFTYEKCFVTRTA